MNAINLSEVLAANELLMSIGGDDQLPRLAAVAIERSFELQSRMDRAMRYSMEPHAHNSPHVRQLMRILDGSITIDDERNEVPEPEHQPLAVEARPAQNEGRGMAERSVKERKAFREWAADQGFDIPVNMKVPQHYLDAFDEVKGGAFPAPKPRQKTTKGPRGKLRPGHGLEGRSTKQRLEIRAWIAEQGIDIAPSGRIPQKHIEAYDLAQEELRRMRAEQYARQQVQPEQQEPEGEQREHAS
jgi:hypothetical protein